MAVVFEAIDTTLNRHVALKVLPPHFSSDEERSTRFRKEVLAVAALDHPSVVTIFEVNEVDDLSYFAMSLAPGGNLKERIGDKKLSPKDSLKIARHIATALHHAHSMDIIHRDIKPENILFSKDDIPVLADFGIAKLVTADTNLTSQGQSLGTPYYMSPEQAQAQRDIDHRSDLYSLAVVLYEMLTGSPPYNANTALGIALMHVSDPLPRLPTHLAMIQPLIDKAMAKIPDDRYQDAVSLTEAIDALSAQINGLGDDLAVRKSIRQRQVTRRNSEDDRVAIRADKASSQTSSPAQSPDSARNDLAVEKASTMPKPQAKSTPPPSNTHSDKVADETSPKKSGFINPVKQHRRKRQDTQFDLMAVTPPPRSGVSGEALQTRREQSNAQPASSSAATNKSLDKAVESPSKPEPSPASKSTAPTKSNKPFPTSGWTASATEAPHPPSISSRLKADLSQTMVTGQRPISPADIVASTPTYPAPPMQMPEPASEQASSAAGLKLWLPVAGLVIVAVGLMIWVLIPEPSDDVPEVVQNTTAQSEPQQDPASSNNDSADEDIDSFFDAFDSPAEPTENTSIDADEPASSDTPSEADWATDIRDEPPADVTLSDRSQLIEQLSDETFSEAGEPVITEGVAADPVYGPATSDPELAMSDERLLKLLRINLLLDQAQGHLRANRLTRPEGNNAVDIYRQILIIDPESSQAAQGLQKVATSLMALASRRLEDSGDQSAARALLNRAVSIGGTSPRSEQLKQQIEQYQPPREALVNPPRSIQPGQRFSDLLGNTGNQGPLLVEVPSGTMVLGAEIGNASNQPPYSVEFSAPFAIGATEVTRNEFARFIDQNDFQTDAQRDGGSCTYWVFGWTSRPGKNWETPGFDQGGNDPVVCVSHADVQAYLRWLSNQTGERYRLPTDSEWEYAARLGVQPGSLTAENICEQANIADFDLAREHKTRKDSTNVFQCEDGYGSTTAVARFDPSPLGLFDTIGNVSEWVADCWTANHSAARSDGAAVGTDNCTEGVSRGGSWIELPANTSSVSRVRRARSESLNHLGFRVLREL